MFRLASEDALRAAFRPKDGALLEPPPGATYPLTVLDYLAWAHPAGGRVFLVFAVPGGTPTGVVFTNHGGTAVSQMCHWCHSWGLGSQVALLTAQLNANKRVGVHICSDLSCKVKVEDHANRTGTSAVAALKQLVERIGLFASDGLKIDLFRA
jgi:hypothetical protein